MTSGVPQGSSIGSLLFIAYVNDIDKYVGNCNLAKYGDDIKIYKKIPKNQFDLSVSCLQSKLNSLQNWADEWQLSFNSKKCSVLHFGYKNPNHVYKIGRDEMVSNDSEKYLGVSISSDLKFSAHVVCAVKKAQSVLAVLKRFI